jgi:phosphoglycolate phosphatase
VPLTPATSLVLLFDIDGTLLLSGGAGKRSLNRAFFRIHGVPDAFAGIRPHGMTDPAIFRQMVRRTLRRDPTKPEMAELATTYLNELEKELVDAPTFQLMPGIPSILDRLSGMEWIHMGLATGNLERASRLKLKRGGIAHHFAFGGFGSDAEDRARLTDAACQRGRAMARNLSAPVVVVGDTVLDVQAARSVGARSLAVCTTGADRITLQDAGADLVLDDLSDAESFLAFLEQTRSVT